MYVCTASIGSTCICLLKPPGTCAPAVHPPDKSIVAELPEAEQAAHEAEATNLAGMPLDVRAACRPLAVRPSASHIHHRVARLCLALSQVWAEFLVAAVLATIASFKLGPKLQPALGMQLPRKVAWEAVRARPGLLVINPSTAKQLSGSGCSDLPAPAAAQSAGSAAPAGSTIRQRHMDTEELD